MTAKLRKGEMNVICLCEILDQEKYHLKGQIAIFEDKKTILQAFGLKNHGWLSLWDIDCRILTLCYDSLIPEYDKFIVVYDYEAFCANTEIREAILFHELGHIEHPVPAGEVRVEAEMECDRYAIENGYRQGLLDVLIMLMDMAKNLNNALLKELTSKRLERVMGS